MKRYGFAAEPHKIWLSSPATEDNGVVTCEDPSGFLGAWEMKPGGVFFPSKNNKIFDEVAMSEAFEYCQKMNCRS